MRDDLRAYVDNIFLKDLENLMRAQNIALLGTICDKTLKARPRFGEVYLYQGFVFKSQKKNSEALMAFAKGSVITNQLKHVETAAGCALSGRTWGKPHRRGQTH